MKYPQQQVVVQDWQQLERLKVDAENAVCAAALQLDVNCHELAQALTGTSLANLLDALRHARADLAAFPEFPGQTLSQMDNALAQLPEALWLHWEGYVSPHDPSAMRLSPSDNTGPSA
ncbi:MAG: hypothetical protein ABIW82_16930 [Dokdonella sp.]